MQRLDRYGDPRLPVEHPTPDLHDALYWHVAAALRGALLKGGAAEASMLDDIIETTVADRLRQPRPLRAVDRRDRAGARSEEQTSELQSIKRNPYAVFVLKKKYN